MIVTVLVALLIQVVIGSVIGAVILRAACSAFNTLFGGKPTAQVVDRKYENVAPAKSDSPYQSPGAYAAPSVSHNSGVPQPGFGNALLICLVSSIINAVVGVGIGIAMASLGQNGMPFALAAQGLSLIAGYMILAVTIMFNLPTSIGRALAVAGLFVVIAAIIGVGLGLVVFFILGGGLFFT